MADMEIILIPSGGKEWLLFPQVLVSRVFPYAPSLAADGASEFVVGSMLVQNEKMPVVDFLFTPRETPYEEIYRIVLVSTITNQSSYYRYAMISYGEPELITLGEEHLHYTGETDHRFLS